MDKVKLIWVTPNAEQIIVYCARVSNPANQGSENVTGLLRYCLKHAHWSIFEMADMCVEIITSRAISVQMIRHRSFSFQEFSQRYAPALAFEPVAPRRQDPKNRQNSFDDLSEGDVKWFQEQYLALTTQALEFYEEARNRNIAKESARFVLPMSATTRLYMKGSIRSWIHYLQIRCAPETQLEHRVLAEQIKSIFADQFPIIAEALDWNQLKSTEL